MIYARGLEVTVSIPHNGHMAANDNGKKGRIDWPLIKKWVVTTPNVTLSDAAVRFDVSLRSVIRHGSGNSGRWIEKQKAHFRELAQMTDRRLTEILAQDRADDVTAFKQLEFRLQKVVLRSLELLFPPPDAPVEAHLEAEERLKAMSGRELSSVINEGLRTLTETGRHRRLLTGQSTAIFARAEVPDVYIPDSLEAARAIQLRSRMAQKALIAAAEGSPIDIEGELAPPVCAHVESITEDEEDLGL